MPKFNKIMKRAELELPSMSREDLLAYIAKCQSRLRFAPTAYLKKAWKSKIHHAEKVFFDRFGS